MRLPRIRNTMSLPKCCRGPHALASLPLCFLAHFPSLTFWNLSPFLSTSSHVLSQSWCLTLTSFTSGLGFWSAPPFFWPRKRGPNSCVAKVLSHIHSRVQVIHLFLLSFLPVGPSLTFSNHGLRRPPAPILAITGQVY